MPPPQSGQNNNKKKKKKGHAPAHQNKFAFRHNPKSKTTDRILNSPNVGVCRRCHDKIEWRKQYRKYKPRTQPGTCNGCGKRNVLAAYHTICTKCTIESKKAQQLIQEYLQSKNDDRSNNNNNNDGGGSSTIKDNEDDAAPADHPEDSTTAPTTAGSTTPTSNGQTISPPNLTCSSNPKNLRACAICVKEIALPDENSDGDDINDVTGISDGVRKLRLRQVKTIERKQQQAAAAAAATGRADNDNGDDHDDNEQRINRNGYDGGEIDNDDDDDDDPFVKATGGIGLTGEAYRQRLLLQQQEQEQRERQRLQQ